MEREIMTKPSTAEGVFKLFEAEGFSMMKELFENWAEIGYNQDTIEKFGSEVVTHCKNLLGEMVIETQTRKQRLLQDIELLLQKVSDLSKELETNENVDYQNEPLVEIESKLRAQLKELQSSKEKRLTHYKRLLEKEVEICQVLGMETVGLNSSLPSEKELNNFEIYLSKQEKEVAELKEVFIKMRDEILDIIEELSYKPATEFERIICEDYQNFVYKGHNMSKMREFRDRLREELDNLKEIADNKRQELINLWEYLEVSEDKYRKFLKEHSGFNAQTILALNTEIKHCKEVRNKNMSKYVKAMRQEMVKWWDKCRIGQVEREAFHPFHYETITEDTLAIHEMEVNKLRQYYEDNEKIFDLLNQQEEMWNKLKELALRQEDPNRFNNRGGQLLEEEKKRKLIKKNFPKIMEQLEQLFSEYENKHGKIFTIDGLDFDEFHNQQKKLVDEEKENIREALAQKAKEDRKSGKKTPLSASRRNLATSLRSVQTSVKRKLPMERSPTFGSNKKRMVNSEKSRPTAFGSKIRRSGRVSRRILGNSFNSSKSGSKKSSHGPKIVVTDTSESIIGAPYDEFQRGLANRDELRSTLVSDELIKITQSGKKKTPVKTPAKPLRKHGGLISAAQGPSRGTPRPPRSPRITNTPRLTTASSRGEFNF